MVLFLTGIFDSSSIRFHDKEDDDQENQSKEHNKEDAKPNKEIPRHASHFLRFLYFLCFFHQLKNLGRQNDIINHRSNGFELNSLAERVDE